MNKIVLHGAFDTTNFGDILLLCIFKKYIERFYPELEVYSDSVGKDAIKYSGIKKITRKQIIQNQVPVIFCGGGYLGEPSRRKLFWKVRAFIKHFSLLRSLYLNKCKYSLIGVGFGPIENKILRKIAVRAINSAFSVVFRDVESKKFALLYGAKSPIKVTSDAVMALLPSELRNFPHFFSSQLVFDNNSAELTNNKIIIGIHIQMPGKPKQDFKNGLFELLKKYKMVYPLCEFILLTDSRNKDTSQDISRYNLQKFSFSSFQYSGPFDLIQKIHQCHLIITTKLHVGIVASVFNKPVISIAMHQKIQRFYNQIERKELCVEYNLYCNEWLESKLNLFFHNELCDTIVPKKINEISKNNLHEIDRFIKFSYQGQVKKAQ